MGRTQRRRRLRQKVSTAIDVVRDDFLPELFKFLSAAGWQNHTKLSVHSYPLTGRGLCSKKQCFSAGDELIRLPLECLITVATLEADDAFKAQFNVERFDKEQRIPFQSLMAFYVLHLKHRLHKFDAYVNSIPTQFTMPYFCSITELQCLPDAVLERTAAQNRIIRESYLHIKSNFAADNCSCCAQNYFEAIYTLADFKWAYFAVNSRSVYLNSREIRPKESHFKTLLADEPNLALAPFLDLFNHSANVSTSAELVRSAKDGNAEYVVTLQQTHNVVKPRSQLFISYGPLTNLKLLTEYGFFEHANPYDYFEFSLQDIEQWLKRDSCFRERATLHSSKFKFIRAHNLNDQMFVHTTDGLSYNLRVVLHLLFKEPSCYPHILQQVAFGDVEQLQNVTQEARLLIEYKIAEYQQFGADLARQFALSASGTVALEYLQECVRYLRESLDATEF